MTILGRTILVLSLFVGVTGCRAKSEAPAESAAEDRGVGPALTGTPPQVQLLLPSRFEEALAAAGGSFAIVAPAEFDPGIVGGPDGGAARWSEREAPFGVLADFDGNGAQDVVLLQRSASEERVVSVLDVSPRPRVVVVQRWARAEPGETRSTTRFYLRFHPAGTVRVPIGEYRAETSVTLPHDGVEVVAYGQAARIAWFSEEDFAWVTTAD